MEWEWEWGITRTYIRRTRRTQEAISGTSETSNPRSYPKADQTGRQPNVVTTTGLEPVTLEITRNSRGSLKSYPGPRELRGGEVNLPIYAAPGAPTARAGPATRGLAGIAGGMSRNPPHRAGKAAGRAGRGKRAGTVTRRTRAQGSVKQVTGSQPTNAASLPHASHPWQGEP